MNKPDGYTIFCDDIRNEVGNKISLMGIYGAELVVNQPFPITLHRLGFHVVFREDVETPPRDIVLQIFMPDDPVDKPAIVTQLHVSSDPLPPVPANAESGTRRVFGMNAIIGPVQFNEPGRIKVRIKAGDEEIKMGQLLIKSGPPQQEIRS